MILFKRGAAAEARTESVDRVFQEIESTFRVTGVSLVFKTLARHDAVFPEVWDGMRPNAETRAFEDAADKLRAEAVDAADAMGRLSALPKAQLGESQAYHVQAALALYHYVNPKLLVFASALAQALEARDDRARPEGPHGSVELIERGAPRKMAAMELVDERPSDDAVKRVFRDIKRTYNLSTIIGDYRALALWPNYLASTWERLKPLARTEGYRVAAGRLRDLARQLALELPYPMALPRGAAEMGALLEDAREFERILPPLILNVAAMSLDWEAPELLRRSPFPAPPRPGGEVR